MKNTTCIYLRNILRTLLLIPSKVLNWCSRKYVFKILIFLICTPWIIFILAICLYIAIDDWFDSNETMLFHLKQHKDALTIFWINETNN